MFDDCYIAELNIWYSETELEKVWCEITSSPSVAFKKMFWIGTLNDNLNYWSIIFNTHGGY